MSQPPGSRNELSGTVIGPSVQAGAIHGGVHVHEPEPGPTPVPRQLIAPPRHFTNRRADLARLSRAGAPIVVVTGPGGVGKTALVRAWAHSVRNRFPDGQLYLDLGGFSGDPPTDPRDALAAFLRALGVPAQRIPIELAEQAALYRTMTAGRALLVVLDNAYSVAQVRVLLPAPPASVTVVTSRSRLVGLVPDGARLLDLAPLDAEDSLRLLATAVGSDRIGRERAQAEELAAICGGLPIALCVAAARLAARPRLTVGRIAAELADETQRLGVLSIRDGLSVQAAFDLSYRSLEPATAALYRRLALHPGPEFGPGLAAASGGSPASLDALLDASLLQEVAEERFRLHDLVLLHARQKAAAEDEPGERAAAVRAMAEWYLAAAGRADVVVTPYRRRLPYRFRAVPPGLPDFPGRSGALDWLERERVNLIAAGRAAMEYGDAELAWHLCYVLWPLFLYGKHYHDRAETDRRGIAAAKAWGNTWAEAAMLKRLCGTCAVAGEVDEAERHIRRALRLYRNLGDERGRVDALESLAMLRRDCDRAEEAAVLFAEVLAANRMLGDDRCTGLTLINLGRLLPRLGRSAEAIDLLAEAQRLFARLTTIDPYNEVRVRIGQARAHLGLSELRQAEEAAVDAATRMRDLGSEHGYAEAVDLLGRIAERRGDTGLAADHYRMALDVFAALGSPHAAVLRDRLAGVDPEPRQPSRVEQPGDPIDV
jgi:tetratricopeptide (TPR) repeat protein